MRHARQRNNSTEIDGMYKDYEKMRQYLIPQNPFFPWPQSMVSVTITALVPPAMILRLPPTTQTIYTQQT